METKELIAEFFRIRKSRNESTRIAEYVLPRRLEELRKNDLTIENNVKIIEVNDEIAFKKSQAEQSNEELIYIESELIPRLRQIGATYDKPLATHIGGDSYSSTWVDEDDRVQGIDKYSQM